MKSTQGDLEHTRSGSELADPIDTLTWEIVAALGATVNVAQWLAAREILARFEPKDNPEHFHALDL